LPKLKTLLIHNLLIYIQFVFYCTFKELNFLVKDYRNKEIITEKINMDDSLNTDNYSSDDSIENSSDNLIDDSIENSSDNLIDDSIENSSDNLLYNSIVNSSDNLLDNSIVNSSDNLLDNSIVNSSDNLIHSIHPKKPINSDYVNKSNAKKRKFISMLVEISENFTKIIPMNSKVFENCSLISGQYISGNGIGDRFCYKMFNYCVIYKSKKIKYYVDNQDYSPERDKFILDLDKIDLFFFENNNFENVKSSRIIGIYIFGYRTKSLQRPIRKDILDFIRKQSCINCGSGTDIACDHKNDLYNDDRVLNLKTQRLDDFQPLCRHCNLQKRQVCKNEILNNKVFNAQALLVKFSVYKDKFPWEFKTFDINNIYTKYDSYWYDVENYQRKIFLFTNIIIEIHKELKNYFEKKTIESIHSKEKLDKDKLNLTKENTEYNYLQYDNSIILNENIITKLVPAVEMNVIENTKKLSNQLKFVLNPNEKKIVKRKKQIKKFPDTGQSKITNYYTSINL
jgi:hypothetical protein